MLKRLKHFGPAIVLAAVILYLSTMDGKDLPEVDIVNADKIFHALCYGLFTAVIAYGFKKDGGNPKVWLSALIAILYGLLMEWIQGTFFPYRTFDLFDGAANAVGAIVVALILPFLVRK